MPVLDEEKLDKHVRGFDRRIRLRNAVAFATCGVVAIVFVLRAAGVLPGLSGATFAALLARVGDGAVALAAVLVALQIHRLAGAMPKGLERTGLVAFHLDQLTRQSAALKSSARWFAAPFLPGIVLIFGGQAAVADAGSFAPLLGAAIALTVLCGMIVMNAQAARVFDAEARWLEEMERQSVS